MRLSVFYAIILCVVNGIISYIKNLKLYAMNEGVELEEFSSNNSKGAIEYFEVKFQNAGGERTKSDGNSLNNCVLRKFEEDIAQSPKVLACGCLKWI